MYDVKVFCRTLCGMFESIANQKDIEFTSLFPDEDVVGYFDKNILEKILVNLLSNAFKFTPSGGIIRCTLVKKTEDEIEISIKDTGIGISKENVGKLFNRFISFLIQICKTAAELVCRLSANWSICIKEKLKWIAK
ncbi:MAG: hypothetical protein IPF52_12985 [Saprospiraceae bacterium]|nr:hypothetical protein [Saprospiraceae bacterium]